MRLIADKVDCPVLNAGDGQHEHPTQALLDALTLRHALRDARAADGDLNGLTVTICGDVLHSRVARSNILCLQALGASVRVCAPPALMPAGIEAMGVEPFHDFDAALAGADVVMMLRLQKERMSGQFIPSPREYRHLYGLTLEAAGAGRARCAGHAPRADEPRGRDRQRRRRPARPLDHHPPGRDGRGDPHGLPRRADPRARRGVEGWA